MRRYVLKPKSMSLVSINDEKIYCLIELFKQLVFSSWINHFFLLRVSFVGQGSIPALLGENKSGGRINHGAQQG